MRGLCILLGLALCGCGTDYCWRSSVPEAVRTVSVPTFRNESNVMELGAVATRQVLREFQREGTFKIRATGDAALEVQGVVRSAHSGISAYDRRAGSRVSAFTLEADVQDAFIRCDGQEPPETTIIQAAIIAVYYSQARGGGKTAVDYTMLRFVKKPSGAMPGKVIYTDYRTVSVESDEELVARLRK